VLGSRFPGVFNLGGDLDLFASFIAAGDREGLSATAAPASRSSTTICGGSICR
jgi:hypothetical protein